ncbi:MAG: carboxypeptidase-like regulatory domain-containing protein [Bacteroidota bacterium]
MYPNHLLKQSHGLVLGLLLLLSFPGFSQRTIIGTVTDEKGEPLSGVTVIVVDEYWGVITDENGKYTLQVPSHESVLRFSLTSYSTVEAKVGSQPAVDVKLVWRSKKMREDSPTLISRTWLLLTPNLIYGIPNQPWGGSLELALTPSHTINKFAAQYRRQGGRTHHNFEQIQLEFEDLFWNEGKSVDLNFLANRLKQGEGNQSLAYGVGLDMRFSYQLPTLTLGIGGGKYGDFLRSDVQADYLLYQAGLSQYFYPGGGVSLGGGLKATYWNNQRQGPSTPQNYMWGWEGRFDVRYRSWKLWAEYRQQKDQQLTSIGTGYIFKFYQKSDEP